MLEKYFEIEDKFGSLVLYKDTERCLFIVEPSGIINPNLVKTDLFEATKFGNEIKKDWIYIVNTESVKFPNPLNLLLLKNIKKLPYMKEYIIYAPSIVVRILGKLTTFIIKPNKVLKTKEQFLKITSSN